MELLDSRRLPGANLLWERPGAVIDITASTEQLPLVVEAWRVAARELLDALEWDKQDLCVRLSDSGASLALSAPLDALYSATEVNEEAWASASAAVSGAAMPPRDQQVMRLRALIDEEVNPALIRLREAAVKRGVSFLSDDDFVSVGTGARSQTWPVAELPAPRSLKWMSLGDIPYALITGTNGKTTTSRLLASIVEAAKLTPGISSTDGVRVGNEVVDRGDWSGPGGARLVLRDRRTEFGILETARGGMLRRGLAVESAPVAAVLNVGEDHLGEWGVGSLEGLAETKFIVTRVAEVVVLNADDPVVAALGEELPQPIVWFSLDPNSELIQLHLESGGGACVLEDDKLWLCLGQKRTELLSVADVPVTLGGAARYNIANALAAAAIAALSGIESKFIRKGLAAFDNSVEANPGRLNHFELGGVQALVDYAHNPHGYSALFDTIERMPAERRLIIVGQAGDREESAIRELARQAWAIQPDRVVIKEMEAHLRGRELGEIPAMFEHELREAGADDADFVHAPSEFEAVRSAFEWAQPGDLLVLLCHDERDRVLQLISRLQSTDWSPGQAVLKSAVD